MFISAANGKNKHYISRRHTVRLYRYW